MEQFDMAGRQPAPDNRIPHVDREQFSKAARVSLVRTQNPEVWALLCGDAPPIGARFTGALALLRSMRLYELEYLLGAMHSDYVERLELDVRRAAKVTLVT